MASEVGESPCDRKGAAFPAWWTFTHREAWEMSSGENAQDGLVRIPRIAVRLEQEPWGRPSLKLQQDGPERQSSGAGSEMNSLDSPLRAPTWKELRPRE